MYAPGTTRLPSLGSRCTKLLYKKIMAPARRGCLIHNESLRVWISYSSLSVWASATLLEPSNCSDASRPVKTIASEQSCLITTIYDIISLHANSTLSAFSARQCAGFSPHYDQCRPFYHQIGCKWPALVELSKRHGVQANQISICKRAAIENMATAFTKRGTQTEKGSVTKVDKLHSKIRQ